MGMMPQNFFPSLDKPYFRADVFYPDGYSINDVAVSYTHLGNESSMNSLHEIKNYFANLTRQGSHVSSTTQVACLLYTSLLRNGACRQGRLQLECDF